MVSPKETSLPAMILGDMLARLEWPTFGQDYQALREEMEKHLKVIGLDELTLPSTYKEFVNQNEDIGAAIRKHLKRDRAHLGGDVLAVPFHLLGYLPLRCITFILFGLDWEMERVLLEGVLEELDVDLEQMRKIEKEAGWVQIFIEGDDVQLSSGDAYIAALRFRDHILKQWLKTRPDSFAGAMPMDMPGAGHGDAIVSAVIAALQDRKVFDAVSDRVAEMSEPGDPTLDPRDHVGFAEQWLRWYSGAALPRDRLESRLWQAFESIDEDTQTSIGRAIVGSHMRAILSDPANIKSLVLLVHGIRTQAPWQEVVASVLDGEKSIDVLPIKYGFVDTLQFLLPFTRSRPLQKLSAKIAAATKAAHNDNAFVQISVIAHSFGTFGVGHLLQSDKDLHLHRLLLCGAILPQDFDWETIQNQVSGAVLNECGSSDIWPVLAQSVTWGYGASGTFGFGHPSVRDRFHNFGHYGYLNREFAESFWRPFILSGDMQRTDWDVERPPTPYWMSLVSLIPLRWLLLGALLVSVTWIGID